MRTFDSKDEYMNANFSLKEVHSKKVQKHSKNLAKSLDLNQKDILLAETIGLLHDIGRFYQFFTYKTYKDTISVNHAACSARILQNAQFFHDLPNNFFHQLMVATYYHNVFLLPSQLASEDLFFCKIIRDADKMDIFRVIIENPGGVIRTDKGPFVWSTEIWSALEQGKCCLYSDVKSEADRTLLQLSWIYDISFPYTYNYLYSSGVFQEFVNVIPQTVREMEPIQKALNFVKKKSEAFSSLKQ
ncbi:MAG: HD domain-containing protein [Caldisericia bacterium]|nr:HD domain-containing protein [Caldisericia bacterium]